MDGSGDDAALETLRIDKWLWAARFFKTRSLAAQAVSGGLVQVADQRVKASRRLRAGGERSGMPDGAPDGVGGVTGAEARGARHRRRAGDGLFVARPAGLHR